MTTPVQLFYDMENSLRNNEKISDASSNCPIVN